MIQITSNQPNFECDRKCGTIIETGRMTYIYGTQIICKKCALTFATEGRAAF